MGVIEEKKKSEFSLKSFVYGLAVGSIVILLVTAVVIVIRNAKVVDWNYHGHYPDGDSGHWNYNEQEIWSGMCTIGTKQSPIALTESASNQSIIPSLVFQNFEDFSNVSVTNNGHSVQVLLNTNSTNFMPKVFGGWLRGQYTLNNIHFHWPSEHTINGLHSDLEGHFVFYSEEYSNLTEALQYPYGVTVVGVLFNKSNTVNHNNFKTIDEAVKVVSQHAGTSHSCTNSINLSAFQPAQTDKFFTYIGSLTTPECTENVIWIVFQELSGILPEDLDILTDIYTTDMEKLTVNNRKIQDVNQRTVYINSGLNT